MANFCSQTLAGLSIPCESSVGGIKVAYIANFGDVESVQYDKEVGMITGITMAENAKFHAYQFRKGTSSMSSTLTNDETVGLSYVNTELNLVFTKLETAKRIEMSALALGQLAVIVLDSNGKYWYLGYNEYVSATAGTAETGTAKTDGSRYTITLTDQSETFPYEIQASVVEGLITEAN